jgi:hypothetical protein
MGTPKAGWYGNEPPRLLPSIGDGKSTLFTQENFQKSEAAVTLTHD